MKKKPFKTSFFLMCIIVDRSALWPYGTLFLECVCKLTNIFVGKYFNKVEKTI